MAGRIAVIIDLDEADEAMVRQYFGQVICYASETKRGPVDIAQMHPTYAANAAARLLRDATTWQFRAGVTSYAKNPNRWMIQTALWQALIKRAGVS